MAAASSQSARQDLPQIESADDKAAVLWLASSLSGCNHVLSSSSQSLLCPSRRGAEKLSKYRPAADQCIQFLKLPLEIRRKIYYYYVPHKRMVNVSGPDRVRIPYLDNVIEIWFKPPIEDSLGEETLDPWDNLVDEETRARVRGFDTHIA